MSLVQRVDSSFEVRNVLLYYLLKRVGHFTLKERGRVSFHMLCSQFSGPLTPTILWPLKRVSHSLVANWPYGQLGLEGHNILDTAYERLSTYNPLLPDWKKGTCTNLLLG